MTREEIYQQIEEMFGSGPTFFKMVPNSSLELEWQLFRRVQFDEGPIPDKCRELMGVAVWPSPNVITAPSTIPRWPASTVRPMPRSRALCTTQGRAPAGAPI